MKKPKREPVSISLLPFERDWLDRIAERQGISRSQLVRKILGKYVRQVRAIERMK